MKIDRSIEEAWQTVQLSSDQFIICHGWGYTSLSLHRLCVINSEGQIIKSYGRERGRGEGQLDCPHSLTIDNNRGLVFVADFGNDRVLMFNRDLTLLGQVQTRQDLKQLWFLYFDSSSDRLFVGERSSGRVLIIRSPDRCVKEIKIN